LEGQTVGSGFGDDVVGLDSSARRDAALTAAAPTNKKYRIRHFII